MSGMQNDTKKKHLSAAHIFDRDELPEGVTPPEEAQEIKPALTFKRPTSTNSNKSTKHSTRKSYFPKFSCLG